MLIKGDFSSDSGEIFCRGDGCIHLGWISCSCALHRIGKYVESIIAEGGDRIRIVPILLAVGRDERGDLRVGALVGKMIGKVAALHRVPPHGDKLRGIPAIPTDEGNRDAELTGLTDNQGGIRVIGWEEDCLGVTCLDRGQLSAEVLVSAAVALLSGDHTAVLRELSLEAFGQTHAVVLGNISKDGSFGYSKTPRKFCTDLPLKGINEADAENMVSRFGDFLAGG